jgi:hypothetical protein
MSGAITINPRDFIMGPFLTCPKCGALDLGVLSVSDTRCERRCRICWYTTTVRLPQLKKKIVYIDQSAISNIMKVLSPEVKGHARAVSEPFWKELFENLSVACHLQLVVCPESREHEYESLTSPFYPQLKNTYEHFSAGVSLDEPSNIRHLQVVRIASSWLRKDQARPELDPQNITQGNIHDWSPRIRASVDGQLPGMAEHLRRVRGQAHDHLEKIFKIWQQHPKTFKQAFGSEKPAYRRALVLQCQSDLEKLKQIVPSLVKGEMPPIDDVLPSESTTLITALCRIFMSALGPDKWCPAMIEFFCSDAIDEAPFNLIQSAMYASLATKAAAGQKEPPNQGTFRDVDIVSTLLPYCDAMFVDNKSRALWQDIPREYKPPYPCAVFSFKTGHEFIRYLKEITDSASLGHLKLLEEVYGPNPLEPQSGIPGVGKFRSAAASG